MKFFTLIMLILNSALPSAHAAIERSIDYACEMNNRVQSGTVQLDDQFVNGKPSCMNFGSEKTICWRFERHVRMKDIYLALRFDDQLRSSVDSNFIQLSNILPAEGSSEEITVKKSSFQNKTLKCTYKNVRTSTTQF